VKLFVGRLPREVGQHEIRECFEEFGEVFEVFVIDSQAMSNVGCAFVRMAKLDQAERAIAELHEQRVLVPSMFELGPMQVAFAKGEAVRLGLDEKEEVLPSFKEARMKVQEHHDKRRFFEAVQKRRKREQTMTEQQRIQLQARNAGVLPKQELIALIKDGQRNGGTPFKTKWWKYCDQGWAGIYDYDPAHHPPHTLVHFIMLAACEHGLQSWFKNRLENVPLPPPGMLSGPPLPPPPLRPQFRASPGLPPPGLPPPPFGPPPVPPGMLPGMIPPFMLPPGPFPCLPSAPFGGASGIHGGGHAGGHGEAVDLLSRTVEDEEDEEEESKTSVVTRELKSAAQPPGTKETNNAAAADCANGTNMAPLADSVVADPKRTPAADVEPAPAEIVFVARKLQDYTDVDALSVVASSFDSGTEDIDADLA